MSTGSLSLSPMFRSGETALDEAFAKFLKRCERSQYPGAASDPEPEPESEPELNLQPEPDLDQKESKQLPASAPSSSQRSIWIRMWQAILDFFARVYRFVWLRLRALLLGHK